MGFPARISLFAPKRRGKERKEAKRPGNAPVNENIRRMLAAGELQEEGEGEESTD